MKTDKKYHELSYEEVEAYAEQDYVPPEAVSLNAIPLRTLEQIVSPHSLAELIEARANSSKSLESEMFDFLSPLEREIIRLRFIENLSEREVAAKITTVTFIDGKEIERSGVSYGLVQGKIKKIKDALRHNDVNLLNIKDK